MNEQNVQQLYIQTVHITDINNKHIYTLVT